MYWQSVDSDMTRGQRMEEEQMYWQSVDSDEEGTKDGGGANVLAEC